MLILQLSIFLVGAVFAAPAPQDEAVAIEAVEAVPYVHNEIEARVATKIFEGFGEHLSKEFIMGREPVSIIHYTRLGTCINHPLH